MHQTSKRISRRALLKVIFAAGLGGSFLGALGTIASFIYPSAEKNPSRVLLARASSFPVGSKTLFNVFEGRDGVEAELFKPTPLVAYPRRGGHNVWLMRLEAGFLALSAKCTHLGAHVPWNPDFEFADPATGADKVGWFRCPAHGATFNDEGVRVFGPAPRSLDRFDLKIVNGNIYMDYMTLREGTNDNAKYAVDPDAKV